MKIAKILFIFLFSCVFMITEPHSWLHCADYDVGAPLGVGLIQNSKCAIFPRGVSSSNVFGLDVGFDFRPSQQACKISQGKSYPIDKVRNYRLVWPAKNHKSDICTNNFIPDTRLQLYAYPSPSGSPDPNFSTWTKSIYMFHDFKSSGGFQNCKEFCKDKDKSPCFGDVKYSSLKDGEYKILWLWEFNKGELYTHCYDIKIGNQVVPTNSALPPSFNPPSSTNPLPPSGKPTPKATQAPTPKASCAKQYESCNNVICCNQLVCKDINPGYKQCESDASTTCYQRYKQCDGQGFKKQYECCQGTTCKFQNDQYSQCE